MPEVMKLTEDALQRGLLTIPIQRAINVEEVDGVQIIRGVSFSSEYEEALGKLFVVVLEHNEDSVDLTRVEKGNAPFLWNHNRETQLGTILNARVEKGMVVGDVAFSNNDFPQQKLRDIRDNIIRSVSVRAKPVTYEERKREDGVTEMRITKWRFLEASLTPLPVDDTIGISRGIETQQTGNNMPEEKEKEKPSTINIEVLREEQQAHLARMEDSQRVHNILSLARDFARGVSAKNVIERAQKATQPLEEGGESYADFAKWVTDSVMQRQVEQPDISSELGLSEKDKRQYSFLRACRLAASRVDSGLVSREEREGCLELEVSRAMEAHHKLNGPNGIYIPIREVKRTLTAEGSGAGGDMIGEQMGEMVDILRDALVLREAGATVLDGVTGTFRIPKWSTGVTAYNTAEGVAPTESTPNSTSINMSPKSVSALTLVTKQLLLQSSLSVEAWLQREIMSAIAIKMQYNALHGTGGDAQPLGLIEVDGINSVTFGAAPTHAKVVEFKSKVKADNMQDPGAYIIDSDVAGTFETTTLDTGSGRFLLNPESQRVVGRPYFETNFIDNNKVFYGAWRHLIMAIWGVLDLTVDNYTNADTGEIRMVGHQLYNTGVRYAEAFAVSTDAGNQS